MAQLNSLRPMTPEGLRIMMAMSRMERVMARMPKPCHDCCRLGMPVPKRPTPTATTPSARGTHTSGPATGLSRLWRLTRKAMSAPASNTQPSASVQVERG